MTDAELSQLEPKDVVQTVIAVFERMEGKPQFPGIERFASLEAVAVLVVPLMLQGYGIPSDWNGATEALPRVYGPKDESFSETVDRMRRHLRRAGYPNPRVTGGQSWDEGNLNDVISSVVQFISVSRQDLAATSLERKKAWDTQDRILLSDIIDAVNRRLDAREGKPMVARFRGNDVRGAVEEVLRVMVPTRRNIDKEALIGGIIKARQEARAKLAEELALAAD